MPKPRRHLRQEAKWDNPRVVKRTGIGLHSVAEMCITALNRPAKKIAKYMMYKYIKPKQDVPQEEEHPELNVMEG